MSFFYGEGGLKYNIALIVLKRENISDTYINVDEKYH
jgi:hypothetical protein